MGAFESGQSFLAGVLAKLPAEQRAQVEAVFNSPEAKDAVVVLGDGALARPDYSKAMNELKAKEQELTQKFDELNSWYDVNKAALQEYPTLKAAASSGAQPPATPPAARPAELDPRDVARQVVDEAGRDYVQVSAWLAGKAVQHAQMFTGEPLDTMAIVQHPKLGRPIVGQPGRIFSLDDAYRELHGERVTTYQKAQEDQKFNTEVDRRLAEKLKGQANQPFPLRGEAPSVLDVLQTKEGSSAHTLDSALAEYERLQGARGA